MRGSRCGRCDEQRDCDGANPIRAPPRSAVVRVSSLVAVLAAALVLAPPSQAAATRVAGSGVVGGDSHFAHSYRSGRFALDVRGRSGWIRYINRAQRVRFFSTRITLFRDESFDRFEIVALAGTGTLNGRFVRFYVRCIDDGGPPNDVFYLNFRDRGGFWLSEGGGRVLSGNVVIS